MLDCMKNVHPVYNIKRLIIMKELSKDKKLKDGYWSHFLPSVEKKNVLTKNTKKAREKKAHTPFLPAPTSSKVDNQLNLVIEEVGREVSGD